MRTISHNTQPKTLLVQLPRPVGRITAPLQPPSAVPRGAPGLTTIELETMGKINSMINSMRALRTDASPLRLKIISHGSGNGQVFDRDGKVAAGKCTFKVKTVGFTILRSTRKRYASEQQELVLSMNNMARELGQRKFKSEWTYNEVKQALTLASNRYNERFNHALPRHGGPSGVAYMAQFDAPTKETRNARPTRFNPSNRAAAVARNTPVPISATGLRKLQNSLVTLKFTHRHTDDFPRELALAWDHDGRPDRIVSADSPATEGAKAFTLKGQQALRKLLNLTPDSPLDCATVTTALEQRIRASTT